MNLYIIYDRLAESAQGSLFEQPNHVCALRAVRTMLAASSIDLTGYELWYLGTYDSSNLGPIDSHPELIDTVYSILGKESDNA